MRILLTGRKGQVGWELERALPALGQVIATDRATLDLADSDAIRRVVREAKPEVIVNPAAYTAVDRAESEPELAFAANAMGVGVLAEEAASLDALLVHFSTDYVFDGEKRSPYVESDVPRPLGVYGKSKLEGERAIEASGCEHVILRSGWIYSTRGSNFVLSILHAAREGRPLRVVSDQVGGPTSAQSLVRATAQILTAHGSGWAFPVGLYHAAATGAVSRSEFARAILAEAGIAARIAEVSTGEYPTPAKRPRYSVLDCTKLRQAFGISLPDWREELRAVVRAIH